MRIMHSVFALSCAVVCRFHLLKPEYIYHRIKQLQKSFQLRIILCYVDVDDVVEALGQVSYADAGAQQRCSRTHSLAVATDGTMRAQALRALATCAGSEGSAAERLHAHLRLQQ